MPIHFRENQYNGINAHLHSLLQREDSWQGFHASYIVNLTHIIDSVLPEAYYALNQLVLGNADTPFEEDYLQNAIIYQHTATGMIPIVRIELLSPVTKTDGLYADLYAEKSRQALSDRIVLVEIDFSSGVNAYPHRITVSDPRLSPENSVVTIYDFSIDVPIPVVDIGLSDEHTIAIDFNTAYQHTFNTNRYYGRVHGRLRATSRQFRILHRS